MPTAETVGEAIAQLKPAKREAWRAAAKEGGWAFEAYVIARIRRNVEHRRQRLERFKASTKSKAPAVVAPCDGLEPFSTQQIEEELCRRKRRRRDSWVEPAAKREAVEIGVRTPQPTQRSHIEERDSRPPQHLLPPQDIWELDAAPPSGGEASRADTSFARTTSFVTARETDDASSICSSELVPPMSPTEPSSQQEDSLRLDFDTQDFREFMETTQFRDADQPDVFVTPYTHGARSSSGSVKSSPASPSRRPVPKVEEAGPRRTTFNLRPENVPPGSRRVWCVRKGLVCGFHFQKPYLPTVSQSEIFNDMRFQVFDITATNTMEVIQAANQYMNHSAHECKPEYAMCFDECSRVKAEARDPCQQKAATRLHALQSEGTAPGEPVLHRCSSCKAFVDNPRAVLCGSCAHGPFTDPDIDFCSRSFDLCREQEEVLRQAASGHNVFYTGAAGTGKSTTLRAMVKYFRNKAIKVEIVSPTGITALNVGGITIHMFAGWTPKSEEHTLSRLRKDAGSEKRFKRLSAPGVLIIDEISMVSNFTLTRLDCVMRAARHSELPFGGVLLIVTGDFFQLPPVKYVSGSSLHCVADDLP